MRAVIRDMAAHDDASGSYVVALHARIRILEQNIARLTARKKAS